MPTINYLIISLLVTLLAQFSTANPLRPDQKIKYKTTSSADEKKAELEVIKWPRANKIATSIQFSNSRIDGFQIANNTTGTLVSEINMAIAIQYFNWLKKEYDFSVGLNLESISMMEETNSIPIDNSKVMAIGLNGMGRYQFRENIYIKGVIGLQDKLFYAPNQLLTGYEIHKPMVPFLAAGFSILLAEIKKIKFGIDMTLSLYQPASAGTSSAESGQGYEIKLFSLWPRGSEQIVSEFFYHSRIQNTLLIRTQEQKIGLGVGYQF